MEFIKTFNMIIFILITAMYAYQMFYIVVALVGKHRDKKRLKSGNTPPRSLAEVKQHRYGVLISARNESSVIGQLIDTIQGQKYPKELVEVFVVADNCTDNTAQVAREHGAIVYRRFDKVRVGKGYALDYAFHKIAAEYGDSYFDGYFVFDADNLLDEHYIEEMNKVFSQGYRVITSYRNSKNFGTNWLSAGYGLWFLREAKYLNNPRMRLGTSCAISGTGFLLSSAIIREQGGWIHHLLTEDIEFTVDNVLKGETIGYCETAVLYDEQPEDFAQSWHQRMRWCKGFYQIICKYGKRLICGIFRKDANNFACYDMTMTVMPATFVSLLSMVVNAVFLCAAAFGSRINPILIRLTSQSLIMSLLNYYMTLFVVGVLTTITEWKAIKCPAHKKILYTFTFPLFLFTYIPISLAALFQKVEWKPIEHRVAKTLDEVR